MKTVLLFAAVVLAGAVRQPAEGPITVSDEDADRIVENLQGEIVEEPEEGEAGDGLDDMTVGQLKELAASRGIDLGAATKKAEIIAVIAAHSAG